MKKPPSTLIEFKNQLARESGYKDWQHLCEHNAPMAVTTEAYYDKACEQWATYLQAATWDAAIGTAKAFVNCFNLPKADHIALQAFLNRIVNPHR